MKTIKLSEWFIYATENFKIVQEDNTAAVFDMDKNFVMLMSINEKGNIVIEKCSQAVRCEINHSDKQIFIELW